MGFINQLTTGGPHIEPSIGGSTKFIAIAIASNPGFRPFPAPAGLFFTATGPKFGQSQPQSYRCPSGYGWSFPQVYVRYGCFMFTAFIL